MPAGPARQAGGEQAPPQQKKVPGSPCDMLGPPRQLPVLSFFDSRGGFVKEEQQVRLHPADIPEWRRNIKKQCFSKFKKLVDLMETERQQQITGRAVSHLMAAKKLEKERQIARNGKKQGLTAMLKQMQAAARSKRNDSGGAEDDLARSGGQNAA